MPQPRLIIPGGTGFLGRTVAQWFAARGWDVVALSRDARATAPGARVVQWDARTLGDWARACDGAAAVLNLAGRSVNCRYTPRNRRLIMDSRVDSTRVVGAAIAACDNPPPVWMNASTATIYKHSLDQPMDEATGVIAATRAAKDAFSIKVAQAWERACEEAATPGVRKLLLRTSMVFGPLPGGVWDPLRRVTRLGLGGRMASGRQYVSWMHADDFCRAVEWLIERQDQRGVFNLTAPHPITNAVMMRTLRDALGASIGLPGPRWMLEIGAWLMRTETELLIKSRRVVPGRLLEGAFEFKYPEFRGAIEAILRSATPDKTARR